MQNTEEQDHILSLATGGSCNLMIRALAGTGKTTTLELIEKALPPGPILYLVFNKKNAKEAEDRMLSTTTVRTFNSLGHRVWCGALAKKNAKVDSRKVPDILRQLIDEVKDRGAKNEIWAVFWEVVNAVAMAKALGYVPEGKFTHVKPLLSRTDFHASLDEEPDDLTADLIEAVLTRSIKQAYDGVIDFNDQIYMPALFGGTYPQFPLVLVDEYQDLNPTNHALLRKLVKKRLIGVGDPNQAIYGFRGAKRGGMAEAVSTYSMTECDLSITFRCPSEIVKHVQWHVPKFRWIKEGGSVEQPDSLDASSIPDDGVIICRNNAPLFSMALRLLAHKRSVSVAGSDVGPRIVAMMKKLGPEDMNQQSTLSAIADWRAEKKAKNSATADDIADCMIVFAGFGNSLGQAINYAEHLFKQEGRIQLMTGHKSKGLEFKTVYHLNPWLCQNTEQDNNLRYVIGTRSQDRLIEIDAEAIRW